MEEHLIGGARSMPHESHYDPKTNRCYVQLTVMSAKPGDYATNLYDGQTREMLAFAKVEHGEKVGCDAPTSPSAKTAVQNGAALFPH